MSHYPQPPEKINIIVDKERFLNTRNALTNAFVGLSGAIDEAVKAYVNHTNAVLDGVGGSTLDVSGLVQPFNAIGHAQGVAQLAQQAIFQNGNLAGSFGTPTNPQLNPDGSKKKRQYKPRDPNAPKRPLTAYFRYLQEQRPIISEELQKNPDLQGGKAGDISKIATERWNALDDKTRQPYRKAYEKELKGYEEAVKKYKRETGQIANDDEDAEGEDDDQVVAPVAQMQPPVTAKADSDDSSDDSEDSSSGSSESEDEEPAPPPKPEVSKKTPKPSAKKTKAGADPVLPTPQQFSSLSTPNDVQSSPTRKRKADATDGGEKNKRGRKTKAEKEAADSAAAAAQLNIDPQLQAPQPVLSSQLTDGTEKSKKEKKKKRKSEANAA